MQRPPIIFHPDRHHGIAGGKDPSVHDRRNGLAGDVAERPPQVDRLGVAELVVGEVFPDPIAEDRGAEILLQHSEHRPTFLVSEDVEHGFGVLGGDHLELDGTA